MRKNNFSMLVSILVLAVCSCRDAPKKPAVVTAKGVVSAEAAIAIAEPILKSIYGEENIERERPYSAELKDGIWYVNTTSEYELGGGAFMKIRQTDGKVLYVTHYK